MPRRRRIGKARASASRSTKRRSFTNPLSCAKAQKSQVALQRLVTEISQTAGNTHPSHRLRTDPSTYDAAKKPERHDFHLSVKGDTPSVTSMPTMLVASVDVRFRG